ncbi:hypothetical protein GQX73_g10696 [Xylaria multiplex]|uniref:DUF7587 domain-containing protein n=1 Tax=Xylaria multiplex TaxID=323545 RepID=A0A7C8MZL2_9PEZI|nr:hypothetical protein GQX73_g10696 [Xylaria multiplex]
MYPILDRSIALNRLLYPLCGTHELEEAEHPWRVDSPQPFNGPLLRVWDRMSGSKPEEDGRMMSRKPEMSLSDEESRRSSLSKHIDYGVWTPSPYISFTSCEVRAESLVKKRLRARRGSQMITVIDPNARIRKGLPIIHSETEMGYYGIPDPYNRNNEYYHDEYLCLWQVTAAEIVHHWEWSTLEHDTDWYQNIVLPDFEKFIGKASRGNTKGLSAKPGIDQHAKDDGIDGLLKNFAKLSTSYNPLSYPNSDVASEEFNNSWDDEVDDNEGLGDYDDGYGWDTDDEVEEANAADDMIKIIEGDW